MQSKAKIDINMSRSEKVKALIKQYEELIKYLKENGALLNTIRPQYFLSHADYNIYLKMTFTEGQFVIRITEQKYNYISNEAWITLFYQILKIFYLSRISTKSFKNLPNIPIERTTVENYYLEGSNLISNYEGILLHWLETNYSMIYQFKRLKIKVLSFFFYL